MNYTKTLLNQLTLQNELNIKTCGKNWKLGFTKEGKSINWITCSLMESAELIDSSPWKHWKNINAIPDFINVKIELVDIWHFLLSSLLKLELEASEIVNIIQNSISIAQCDIVIHKTNQQDKINYISNATLEFIHEITTPNKPITNTNSLKMFFILCKKCDLSLEQLFGLYFGKNSLNEFRQLNGYKNNAYFKMWAKNKEDNYFMYEIVMNNPNIGKAELMEEFKSIYKGVVNEAA